jgi:hypothetical protein
LRHGIAATAGSPGRRQFLPRAKGGIAWMIDIDPPVPMGQGNDRGNSAAYQVFYFHEKKMLLGRAACPDSEISAFGVPSSLSLFLARFNAKPDARAVACVSR